MKRLIAGSLMASMLVVPAMAQDVSVYLNNERMVFDQNPIIENGRTLVPLRSIFEGLGAEVKWNPDIQEIKGITSDKEVVLRVGETSATVNGNTVTLDVPAKIENGRTLVPLRFISESLEAEVKWNAEEYRIDIIDEEIKLPEVKEVIEKNSCKYYLCKNGDVYVEGDNEAGQLGLGHKNEVTKPTKVETLNGIKIKRIICTSLMNGLYYNTYYLSEDNNIYICGYIPYEILSLDNQREILIPTRIKELDGKKIKEIECSFMTGSTFYLTVEGDVYVTGLNFYGESGVGHVEKINKIIKLNHIKEVEDIQIGHAGVSTYFFAKNGDLYACGYNEVGQLGLGHKESVMIPTKIEALSGIEIISIITDGDEIGASVYFIARNGDVYVCGSNDIQYDINGNVEFISPIVTPMKINNLEDIKIINSRNEEVKKLKEGIVVTKDNKKIIIKKNIKNFISENPDSEEYFVYEDNGEFYGYEDSLWDGCSTWCSVEDFNVIAKASSTLASQGVYSYSPSNINNEIRSSAWVEGVEGDGIGEYIEISQCCRVGSEGYEKDIKFTELCIVNGYAATEKNWIENNRVKELKMYFEDEYIASIILEDTIKPQYIDISSFDLKVANGEEAKFRFEIASVYKGEKYSDTCLTGIEIEFDGREGH